MKLVSVNVGLPRDVARGEELVRTAIWKAPVEGRVRVSKLNLAGDRQADLTVHGGPNKAVYAYPSEHYPWWRRELGLTDAPPGLFGENLTTEGLTEDDVRVGDSLRVGTAELVVTQPRLPCFKLGIRFGRPDMPQRLLRSGRTGFYLAVVREGEIGAGDPLEWLDRDPDRPTIAEVVHLYTADEPDPDLLRRALRAPSLPEGWRERFRRRLADGGAAR